MITAPAPAPVVPSPLVWWPQTRPEMPLDLACLLVALCTGTDKKAVKLK